MSKFVEGNMKHGDSSKIGRGGEIRAGSIPPRGKMSSSGILGQQQGKLRKLEKIRSWEH